MAQGKQTPRQKMINLMYLVFIAMLAMQIDQEIIRSYKDTSESLQSNRLLTERNNDNIFEKTLQAKAQNSPETYAPLLEKYQGIKSASNDLVSFIEGIKTKLSKEAEYDANADVTESFTALNNTEPSSANFFKDGSENMPSKTAQDLIAKIDAFKKFVNTNFAGNPQFKSIVDRTNQQMVTERKSPDGKNWIQYKFYNQPLIAALSNLEVIESNARGIQADALSVMLQEKVDANIKFDAYQAIVSAPTTVIQGETATAKVSIGNYSSNVPGLSMPGLSVQNGQGVANLNTSGLGSHSFSGTISFQDNNGKVIPLTYNHTYNVIAGAKEVALQSGALVSADKMNVLYRGLPNPVSGSILGADNTQTSLSASGASVSGGRGKWIVTPGAGSTATLTISGRDPKGKTISQSFPFRIKNIPAPQGQIRGQVVAQMPASSIPNQTVSVAMPDFDFPVSFRVNSFMFKAPGKPAMRVSGSSMSAVAGLTKNLRSGDIVYVFKIDASASGLGGQMLKEIPPVVINVQ